MTDRPSGGAAHQLTVRLPEDLWTALMEEVSRSGKRSINEVVVDALASEVARRRRAEVLSRLAEQRAEILRTTGLGDDSTPYIRSLREGVRTDE